MEEMTEVSDDVVILVVLFKEIFSTALFIDFSQWKMWWKLIKTKVCRNDGLILPILMTVQDSVPSND